MPKQALIMIDMQRGFLDSASPLCIPAAEGTVPACAALIGRCHEVGVPVIYAVRHYRADGTDVEKPRAAAWASGGKPLSEDCAAHLSDAFPDAFTVLPQDYVLVKPRFSAFFHTGLDLILRRLGVQTVLLAGTTTPNCIRTTCYDAISLDYDAVVLSDCTSSVTDAVQAAGHLPIDVKAQHIDMLSLSGHKFHGPKGVGLLYARKGIFLTNLIEGGAQERGKRGGTENTPAIAGMAAALREAVDHMAENAEKVTRLRETLIAGLSTIEHARLNGDRDRRVPGTVNFCFEGIEGESLLLLLDRKGIAASSGSACTSGSLDPSHVLLAIGLPHEVAHGSLRLSVGEYNTDEEMAYIVDNVRQVVAYLRNISPVWDELETGARPHLI